MERMGVLGGTPQGTCNGGFLHAQVSFIGLN